jgi:hypothetical protein
MNQTAHAPKIDKSLCKTIIKIRQVDNIYRLKACNVINITMELEIVLLYAYSTERTIKKSRHAVKINKLLHIYMEKTK